MGAHISVGFGLGGSEVDTSECEQGTFGLRSEIMDTGKVFFLKPFGFVKKLIFLMSPLV